MKHVVMIGPSPQARGGMATVIAIMLQNGYCDGARCRFIASQVDGSAGRKAGRALLAAMLFLGLLLRGEVSLLHVHVASGASFWRKSVFIGMARLFRVPVLFHLHGGQFRDFLDTRLSGWRQRLARGTVASCAHAFALTRESAGWLQTTCGVRSVEVFPNPIGSAAALPRRPGAEVLFIGRLEAAKGVFDLLESFPAVLAARPNTRLVLAGDGDRDGVLARALRLGIADMLDLPGWVDDTERARLLARAAVFVLPSWHEQMPMVVLEALAAGTPVVATAVGAVPDLLLRGSIGTLIPPHSVPHLAAAISIVLTDNVLADMYSVSGLEHVRSAYMIDGVLQRLRRRYEELAA